jgi:3-dehydroquinate dehydratase type I
MICVSLSNMGFEECLSLARQEPFVEFRFDLLTLTPDQVYEAVNTAQRSIATFRPGNSDRDLRLQTLFRALEAGANYIDLELDAESDYSRELIKAARSFGREIIISYHNHTETPEFNRLLALFRSCRKRGGDVVKIACQVNDNADLWSLMGLYREGGRMAVIGMGEKGLITRIAAPFLGAEFTFAFPASGRETAPGQIDRNRLEAIIAGIRSSYSMKNNA